VAKRAGVERISDLSIDELLDLREMMKRIEQALENEPCFRPDRFNYWQMGNALHQLHFHGIPRYRETRDFAGQTWSDSTWGSVPVWSKKDVPHELVVQIRQTIQVSLSTTA